jgi:hypothetical protein
MARGGRRKAERAQAPTRGPLLLAVVAVVALVVTAAALVLGPTDDAPDHPVAATPGPSPTPSARASLDLGNLPVARTLACGTLEGPDLTMALGGTTTGRTSYVSGDRVELAPGVTDTAHEDLCGFESARAEAKVWVFAAPVSTTQARRLVRDARGTPRCAFPKAATGFGSPGVTSVCTRGDRQVATLRGLFGDAWLSCELGLTGSPGADVVRVRAERWCAQVAVALGARP